MRLNPKGWIPILMILASVYAVFGFLRPHYSNIQTLQAQKNEYNDVLGKANEATRIMRESLLATYNSIPESDWRRLQKMVPNEPSGIQLVRDLSGLAGVFGIKIDKFSFDEGADNGAAARNANTESAENTQGIFIPAVPTPISKKLTISIDFNTSYPNFTRFLREIEKSLELSDVRSLSVSRAAKSSIGNSEAIGDVSGYNFSLTLDTYWIE